MLSKLTQTLLLLFLIILGLYYGKPFLMPIAFAALFALLLIPLCNFFERWGIKKMYASFLCVLVLVLPLALGLALGGHQLAKLTEIVTPLHEKTVKTLDTIEHIAKRFFGTSLEKQIEHIKFELTSLIRLVEISASKVFQTLIKVGILTILILLYTFFFLEYRLKFQRFLLRIAPQEKHKEMIDTIEQIQHMSSHYLLGMLIITVIIAILNAVGLYLLKVPHALLLGSLAALFYLIPYVGVLAGSIIPIGLTFLTGGSWQKMLGILLLFTLIQLFDNHILKPKIIGFHIKVNPLAIFMFAFLGGLLWGIEGIILFIPLVGILKIIFEHLPHLQPYAYLLSSEE